MGAILRWIFHLNNYNTHDDHLDSLDEPDSTILCQSILTKYLKKILTSLKLHGLLRALEDYG